MAYAYNANYATALASSALAKFRKTLEDNFSQKNILMMKLKEKGSVKGEDGGQKIVQPLLVGASSTVKSYNGLEELDLAGQEGITCGEWEWKENAGTLILSQREIDINSGETQIFKLLDAKMKQLDLSIRANMATQLFSDGTGNGGKDITGLKALVAATGTYAGIARSTDTYWQASVDSTGEALSIADMTSMVLNSQSGGLDGKTNLIVTTSTLWAKYSSLVQPAYRIEDQKLASMGWDNLNFMGVPVLWDQYCQATRMYFLDTDFIEFVYHNNANFKQIGPIQPAKQTATVYIIRHMGNLTTSNCRKQGLLDGKTA